MVRTTGGAPTGDRRVRRTHAALHGALIQLAGDRDLSQISIADVAERAGVSRSTLYDHYRDVHELAEAACTQMIDELIESLDVLGRDPASEEPTEPLRAFFTSLAQHSGLYRSLLGPHGSARVIDHIRRRITAAVLHAPPGQALPTADVPDDVSAVFVAGALVAVATDWLQRGCPRPPAEMAMLTWPVLAACHLDPDTPGCRPGP
ncbi:MAG TPA: TetR/AcrR family transcriptional regulator C-terminal domain-containing protein [Kineosporiaceae bacterium]